MFLNVIVLQVEGRRMGLGKWKVKADGGNTVSRKQQRKDAKQMKKLHRVAFHQRKKVETVIAERLKPDEKMKKKKRKLSAVEETPFPVIKKDVEPVEEDEEPTFSKAEKKSNKKSRANDSEDDNSDAELTYEQYLKEVNEKTRDRQINSDLSNDDDIAIHRYGKLLNLNKKKNIPKSFCDEGLDFLLEFCDAEDRKDLINKDGIVDMETSDNENEDEESDNEEMEVMDLSEGEDGLVDEEIAEDEEEEDENSDEEVEEKPSSIVQDIYGRNVNKATGDLIKFDPRAARKKLAELDSKSGADSESKLKIDRTITGIINRLSEATLIKSKQMFAEVWDSNSKNDVKSSLAKIIWKMIGAPYRLQDSLISTYSLFLGLIHATISSEISSHFVEEFLVDYVNLIQKVQVQDDKAMENRTVLIANLMNFRIIKNSVVLEIFDKLVTHFNIDNLQLIYNLCIYSYKTMKKQAWLPFTEKLNAVLSKLQESPLSSLPRAKFLGEQITELKKSPPSNVDLSIIEQHQKMLYGLLKREKVEVERELGMGLEDLLLAEERGRWWIVGSAFRLPTDTLQGTILTSNDAVKGPTFPQELMDLAHKAKMNTVIRRNIFCTIASADSEDEAFEKLIRLSLKGQQEREIIYVIIQMMLKEKLFNAYYPTLAARFCNFDRKFILTTQYAIWDRLREVGALKPKARIHFAQFVHHLIYTETMHITVLKAVEWGTMSSAVSSVLRRIFSQLEESPLAKLKRIFEPIIDGKKDSVLTEGLRLFLQVNFPDSSVYRKVEEWFCGF